MRCSTALWSRKRAIPTTDHAGAHGDGSPILIVPYFWIGDFVRCHSVVRLLNARHPHRPVDMLATALTGELTTYMPGVRRAIVCDLPRGRLPWSRYAELGRRLRAEGYGTALIMPRTWKSALAPYLAGIPQRVGFFGEARVLLINDMRFGERKLPRMIDRCGALALPSGALAPDHWPPPRLAVSATDAAAFRHRHATSGPVVALCPGAVGPGKQWPAVRYAEVARALAAAGVTSWVLGGPNETPLAQAIVAAAGPLAHDITGPGLRDSIHGLKAADVAVANDSGLMHVAAALGAPTIALFGPTDPLLWGPLNPLVAALRPASDSHDVADIETEQVLATIRTALKLD